MPFGRCRALFTAKAFERGWGGKGTAFLRKGFLSPPCGLLNPYRKSMSKIKSLPGQRLCSSLPPDRIPWETSDAIPRNGHRKVAPQPRALKALELALHIHTAGYNVYLSGESNLGRTYMLREFLEPRIRKAQTPPDLLYVNNFDDADHPLLLSVPRGRAGSCVPSSRRRWRTSARNCPSVWKTRVTSRNAPNCRIAFRPCVPG